MEKEFEYNLKWAIISAIILMLGSAGIAMVSHSNSLSKNIPLNWSSYFYFIIPFIFCVTFLPLLVCKIITKVQERKSKKT